MTGIIMTLIGGLALFLYGMQTMADGMQKAAGDRMRRILEVLTSIPVVGVLVGAFVTAIIQSSSATTVMIIGFVNAGLMTLKQAVGVIMGANIGTTVTAQLIAFKITQYILPLIAVGFAIHFLVKPEFIGISDRLSWDLHIDAGHGYHVHGRRASGISRLQHGDDRPGQPSFLGSGRGRCSDCYYPEQ